MKKLFAVILSAVLLLTLFSCTKTPISQEKITKDYTKISDDGIDTYFTAIDSLSSGEITMKYSDNKSLKSCTVKFDTENEVKKVLAEIKYTDGGEVINYFDGEKLYIIVDGEGKEVESEYVTAKDVYRNLLGAPEEYLSEDSEVSLYEKNDKSGYLITAEIPYGTYDGNDYTEEGKAVVNFYLNADKMPKKYDIFFSIYEDEKTAFITAEYNKIGEKISITSPEFELIQE